MEGRQRAGAVEDVGYYYFSVAKRETRAKPLSKVDRAWPENPPDQPTAPEGGHSGH